MTSLANTLWLKWHRLMQEGLVGCRPCSGQTRPCRCPSHLFHHPFHRPFLVAGAHWRRIFNPTGCGSNLLRRQFEGVRPPVGFKYVCPKHGKSTGKPGTNVLNNQLCPLWMERLLLWRCRWPAPSDLCPRLASTFGRPCPVDLSLEGRSNVLI